MNQFAEHVPPVVSLWPRRLRRWSLWLLPVALLAGAYLYYASYADRYLHETLAELDRTDPGWRLEELEAARPTIPDAKNSALCVMAVHALLPKNPTLLAVPNPAGVPNQELQGLLPPSSLSEHQLAGLSTKLAGKQRALVEARRLADLPDGRYPQPPIFNPTDYHSAHDQKAREITYLLRLDALRLAHQNEPDQALASCRAALNAGRSLGDDPPEMIRLACLDAALQAAERVLAQGEPSQVSLMAWQHLLETEATHPTFLVLLRNRRAAWHVYFTAIESKRLHEVIQFEENLPPAAGSIQSAAIPHVKQVHADLLRYLTGFVDALRLPEEQQPAAFRQWDAAAGYPLSLTRLSANWFGIFGSYRKTKAFVRCALVAAAVERFRRTHGRWPETLAELCPTYLAALPADPFGGPLRYRRSGDGVIVYSVGPDGLDNGGKLDRNNPRAFGTDVGFQLWDVAQRRRPPLPPIVGPPAPGS